MDSKWVRETAEASPVVVRSCGLLSLSPSDLHVLNIMVDRATLVVVQAVAEQGRCVLSTTLGTSWRNRWDISPSRPRSPRLKGLHFSDAPLLQIIAPEFSIFGLVQTMRTQRPSLVQTKVAIEGTTPRVAQPHFRHFSVWCVSSPKGLVSLLPDVLP